MINSNNLLIKESPNIFIFMILAGLYLFCSKKYNYFVVWLIILSLLFYFYRFPKRDNKNGCTNCLYSVADGKIMSITYNNNFIRISCFLSPTDVHVQYAPTKTKLLGYKHKLGRFNLANTKKYFDNESMETLWQTKFGKIKIYQYAGFFVRRIILWNKIGDKLKTGEPFGIIKFGSRVDIILPKISTEGKYAKILVGKNDYVRAGIDRIVEYI